jgi:cytochrome P450
MATRALKDHDFVGSPAEPPHLAAARARAYAMPLDDIELLDPELWLNDTHWPYFERLRDEDPVHYHANGRFGPYWSITRFADIMAVDTDHVRFSSDAHLGGITAKDMDQDFILPMFIAMDPPKHDVQRKAVSPIVSPGNLAQLEGLIRARAQAIFDNLPVGETFDWVDRVSIELTTQMLATLFDFPWDDRRLLTYWSDKATADETVPGNPTKEERQNIMLECLMYFTRLWNERVNAEVPGNDLVSMLAHNPATRDMVPMEYLGNLLLLIVGGNDTTRNSITGGLTFMAANPDEWARLRANPALVESAVSEIIRYQTPLAHMRRTALADVELGGKTIRKGDRVVMWYVSGNRDERSIVQPDRFWIDRPKVRQHLSFGFGIHRCVGNRLAELQLKIVWQEILKRYPRGIEIMGSPGRVPSAFVKGYTSLPVRIPA